MDVAVDGFAYTVTVRQEFPEVHRSGAFRAGASHVPQGSSLFYSNSLGRKVLGPPSGADTVSFHEHTEGGHLPVRVALLVLPGPPRAAGFEPGELEARGVVGHQRALFDQRDDD